MKEKLDAFLAEFKQEAVLDAIQIKLSSNPALDITQSKVGGLFYLLGCPVRCSEKQGLKSLVKLLT